MIAVMEVRTVITVRSVKNIDILHIPRPSITPKLQLSWRKQDSNIPEMYSYTQKNVNMLFEKTF